MITRFQVHRLTIPCGRVIGDCACYYDRMTGLALALTDGDGRTGWGYGEVVAGGTYTRTAPWRQTLPDEEALRLQFGADYWPWLQGVPSAVALNRARVRAMRYSAFNSALEQALWDLQARQHNMPLHRFLGGDGQRTRIRAYGSPLDFHLTDEESVAAHKRFVARGFTALKVKVGHPDPQRDLVRLMKIREAVGPEVEISVDANEGWTADEAIQRITLFENHGVRLTYVEDPLPLADVEGFARLAKSVPVDLAGHDYATSIIPLRRLLEVGALRRLRVQGGLDHALACGALAREFGVTMITGNTTFERHIHVASAIPAVERIEFADLGWNWLVAEPVVFKDGHAEVPMRPGHGLEPSAEALVHYHLPVG
ncbi:MAG: mandelate racemase/muconate lactonizing enzyme family protein [Verrucomicrobiota bacterium]